MLKPNTLTFPLSQSSIIFMGHSNSKMLHHLHYSYHSLSCKARHDASNVPIKPLLDSTLDFSTVKYMQLTKVVPKKSEPLSGKFDRRKILKEIRTKQNDAILSWIALKGLGPTNFYFRYGGDREGPIAGALWLESSVCRDKQLKI